MRARGISYDTGLRSGTGLSREAFDPELVRRELRIIRDDLHCTAVRIIGGDPERLETAATAAADLGLEVWFSPYPLELAPEEMLALFDDCARRAERVRRRGAEVVFVTGAELTVMSPGFVPGDTVDDRVAHLLGDPARARELIPGIGPRINAFLAEAAATVRKRFAGKVTYASIHFEQVDWTPFDIAGFDLYRSAEIADGFGEAVRAAVAAQDKPVAITEFGTATYRGAADRGARVLEVVEADPDTGAPLRLDARYERDEAGQAAYLRELIEDFDAAGVDAAFVFLFALHSHPHRPGGDPRADLDLASLGIVTVLDGGAGRSYPGMPWEPKAAFTELARVYGAAR